MLMSERWLPGVEQVWVDEFAAFPKPKCECGTTKTLGKDDHNMLHSDWCPKRKAYEEDEMIREALKDDSEKKK